VIRAVISDFGGVLTNPLLEAFTAAHDRSGLTFEELGGAMARATEAAGGRHPLFELEKGLITEEQFRVQLEEALGRPLAGFTDVYWEHLDPNAEMIAFMRGLKDRGLRMALLTNNVREWEPLWRSMLPVDEIFEVVVDSAFVGMRKPEPGIYELTLERLDGMPAEECVFLDDLEHNCEAARSLGMRAVLFQSNEQAMRDVQTALQE
jgi:putative hydrolase of the HAD superfamily